MPPGPNDTFLDPFSAVYNRLWDVLESNERWRALVLPGNRISYAKQSQPRQKGAKRSAGDLPEAVLIPAPTGVAPNLSATSTSAHVAQLYNLRVHFDDPRVHRSVFPMKYALLSAFAGQPDDLGLADVARHRVVDVTDDSLGDTAQLYAAGGWASVYTIDVLLSLDRKVLAGSI